MNLRNRWDREDPDEKRDQAERTRKIKFLVRGVVFALFGLLMWLTMR